jgi:prepilin signal peptidase PulO-like enzyme (type II secretory pathway)
VENLTTSYTQLLTSPEELNSFPGFVLACVQLFALGLLVAWPLAVAIKFVLERERIGTSSRVRFVVVWTALALSTIGLLDALTLSVLGRVPHWNAVSPQVTFAFVMGLVAFLVFLGMRAELRVYRSYVDRARRQIV